MVFVHEAFAVVDVVTAVGAPVLVDDAVIAIDDPSPASHFDRAVVVGGGTVRGAFAGYRGPPDVFLDSCDIVRTDRAIAAEANAHPSGVEDVVAGNHDAFAKTPRVGLRRAVVSAAARSADTIMTHVDPGPVVVVKHHIVTITAAARRFQQKVLHREIVLAAFRQTIVRDQDVLRGFDINGRVMPRCEALPSLLFDLGAGNPRVGNGGVSQDAAKHEPVLAALVIFRFAEMNVAAIDIDMDDATTASLGGFFQVNAFEGRVDRRSFSLEDRFVFGKLEPRGRPVRIVVRFALRSGPAKDNAVLQMEAFLKVVFPCWEANHAWPEFRDLLLGLSESLVPILPVAFDLGDVQHIGPLQAPCPGGLFDFGTGVVCWKVGGEKMSRQP